MGKHKKSNAKANQQRWSKEHQDKMKGRNVKATKGGRGRR
ncbi:hypothetical protein ES704_01462 [subsurface metagenome]|jgi:hypothetical protein